MKKRLTALTAACLMALCLSAPVSAASPAAGTVATSSTGLNVRSAPSSTAAIRTSLPKGTAVTLISRSGDWWQVQYGPDSYGYCSAAYIRELSGSSSAANVSACCTHWVIRRLESPAVSEYTGSSRFVTAPGLSAGSCAGFAICIPCSSSVP